MRVSAARMANAAAWVGIGVLILGAVLLTRRLGFLGLLLLGASTWLVCTLASLDQDVPSWGEAVFRAAMERPRSPEAAAAARASRAEVVSPLRFYKGCGAVLAVAGALGFAWQVWG